MGEEKYKLFDAEHKFMDIVWNHEPINSTEPCKICNEKLGWKKIYYVYDDKETIRSRRFGKQGRNCESAGETRGSSTNTKSRLYWRRLLTIRFLLL